MRLLLVNTVARGGSIASYMEAITAEALRRGDEVAIAYGRGPEPSLTGGGITDIKVGGYVSTALHGITTRLFDRHGLGSRRATKRLIRDIEAFAPDIIHLHNIHGYYLHYPTLFEWLRRYGRPVFWTLHDCWSFTGHCPFYTAEGIECLRWQHNCGNCPLKRLYPASILADRSTTNLRDKVSAFTSLPTLTLLPVSEWMSEELAKSALTDVPKQTVKIDVDTDTFRPLCSPTRPMVLGAANFANPLKSISFFVKLRKLLPPDVAIRLAGNVSRGKLPDGIELAGHIKSREAIVREYSAATVFVNPSYAEGCCMATREALACGTPVVSRTTASVEDLIAPSVPVWQADTDDALAAAITEALKTGPCDRLAARRHAEALYAGRSNLANLFELFGSKK